MLRAKIHRIAKADELLREILSVCPERRIRPGLEHIQSTLDYLGHPEQNYRNVLIVGTKGKGSMALFSASYLSGIGYKTGMFTSPHLQEIPERIIAEGNRIPVQVIWEKFWRLREKWETGIIPRLTFFELLTTIAVVWFAEQKMEWVVWEAGMGGRLDATNVLPKDLVLISLIGLDHTEWLGNTHRKIYLDKTAVIPDTAVPAVFSRQKHFVTHWAEKDFPGASIFGRDFAWKPIKGQLWEYTGSQKMMLKLRSLGTFQRDNASTILRGMERLWGNLQAKGVECVQNAFLPGRMELIQREPPWILDGAHNPDSFRALVKELHRLFPRQKWLFLVGIQATKPSNKMIPLLESLADCFVFTDVPGALHPSNPEEFVKYTSKPHWVFPFPESLSFSQNSGKWVCVTGSLYLVGAVRNELKLPIPRLYGR